MDLGSSMILTMANQGEGGTWADRVESAATASGADELAVGHPNPSAPHHLPHPANYPAHNVLYPNPTLPYGRPVLWRTRPHVRWRVYCWITWR